MEPVFDRSGRVVAWVHRGSVVCDLSGSPRAFMRQGVIFSYAGRYLGRLDNGYFRDQSGQAMAFVRGAKGGPLLPITAVPPIPPIPGIPPIEPIAPIPPVAPIASLAWSAISLAELLAT